MRVNVTSVTLLFLSALLFSTPLAAQFGGEWRGNFQELWLCGGGEFTAPGSISMSLTQTGKEIAGVATIVTSVDECVVQTASQNAVTFSGVAVGGTVSRDGRTMVGWIGSNAPANRFRATLAPGPTWSSRLITPDPGNYTFNATYIRPSTASPVIAFSATPATITLGGSTRLSWTTTNAVTVSISDVSGSKGVSGLTDVTPAAAGSVTYTLTATGPNGAVSTATTVVTVNP